MVPPVGISICFRDQGIRWPLRDDYDVQVWSAGHELIATLPGRFIRHLVELHLANAALHAEVVTHLRKPLAPMIKRPTLARIGFPETRREALRQQRRSRSPNRKDIP